MKLSAYYIKPVVSAAAMRLQERGLDGRVRFDMRGTRKLFRVDFYPPLHMTVAEARGVLAECLPLTGIPINADAFADPIHDQQGDGLQKADARSEVDG